VATDATATPPSCACKPADLSGKVARVLGVADVATGELRNDAAEPPGQRDDGQERHVSLLARVPAASRHDLLSGGGQSAEIGVISGVLAELVLHPERHV